MTEKNIEDVYSDVCLGREVGLEGAFCFSLQNNYMQQDHDNSHDNTHSLKNNLVVLLYHAQHLCLSRIERKVRGRQ